MTVVYARRIIRTMGIRHLNLPPTHGRQLRKKKPQTKIPLKTASFAMYTFGFMILSMKIDFCEYNGETWDVLGVAHVRVYIVDPNTGHEAIGCAHLKGVDKDDVCCRCLTGAVSDGINEALSIFFA